MMKGPSIRQRQDRAREQETFAYEIEARRDIETGVIHRETPLVAFLRYARPAPDATILDIGCGTGNFVVKLSMLGFRHVSGIDLSESRVRTAREKAELLGQRVTL